MLKDKEQPSTFYRHESKYNEERAGLYKTSYDPERLTYSMNAQQLSGGNLFNTSNSHVDASLYPTIPWDENEAALKSRSVWNHVCVLWDLQDYYHNFYLTTTNNNNNKNKDRIDGNSLNVFLVFLLFFFN